MFDAGLNYALERAIKKVYFICNARKKALKRNESATPAMKLDGTPKLRMGKPMYTRRHTCEGCGKTDLKITEIELDHISPVGWNVGSKNAPSWWDWNIRITRLFNIEGNNQKLCKETCHPAKSAIDQQEMKDGTFLKKMEKIYLTDSE